VTRDDGTLWLALGPLVVLAVGFAVVVVVDIVRSPSVRHLPKWGWIAVSVLSIPLGGILYLLLGRDRAR
jgi:uncharacterized membrane protein